MSCQSQKIRNRNPSYFLYIHKYCDFNGLLFSVPARIVS
ncbi:hypothetical protein M080_4057 [Bacteroides fragilis str. 3397 T10]|nr:hypothetical protein M080_4057 [Bacteroides fragilis str. 3397 T10]